MKTKKSKPLSGQIGLRNQFFAGRQKITAFCTNFGRWLFKTNVGQKWFSFKNFVLKASWKKRILALVLVMIFVGRSWTLFIQKQDSLPTYETSTATRGTFLNSISASGTITAGNYTNVTTKTSGTVKTVYVTNGQTVQKGQKIAEVELDDYARERQTAAWVAYLEATEAVKEAERAKITADIAMWQSREDLLDAQEDVDNNVGDTEGEKIIIQKTLDEARLKLQANEMKYIDADADIANARANVSKALRDYQENSAIIVAPVNGTITDLALAEGITISASSSTSATSGVTIVSAQTVGKINDPEGQLVASVNLTEIDIINVKANQKVTLTLDAYEDITFTGKVLAVNTSGSSSSGVTNYPVTILLDPVDVEIYPNMAVSVEIITALKTGVILVPTTAIQTNNETTYVEILQDGQPVQIEVETGLTNDSQTEIITGLDEGTEVITATIATDSQSITDSESSPFSGMGSSSREMRFSPPGGF